MKAPERIWIDPATDLPKLSGHIDKDSVEYIRKDAFIENTVNWLINNTDITPTGIKNYRKAVNYHRLKSVACHRVKSS